MLSKHLGIYLVARGISALVNFFSIVVFTRLLTPAGYGEYTLVLTVVALWNLGIFQWIRFGVLRFFPSHAGRPNHFLSTVLFTFLALIILTAGTLIVLLPLISNLNLPSYNILIAGFFLLVAQAWHDLNLELARTQLEPTLYGKMSVLRSILALSIGVLLSFSFSGAVSVLVGLILGGLIPPFIWMYRQWSILSSRDFDPTVLRLLLKYGLPLSATAVLSGLVNMADRLLQGAVIGTEAVGIYGANYDLISYTIGALMVIISLALYPVIVRSLEHEGKEAALVKLQKNISLLTAVSLPATLFFVLLAPNLVQIVLPQPYWAEGAAIMPLIAIASLFSGLKAFHYDLAFQLGKCPANQIWIMIITVALNIILNLLWIPLYGLEGSARAAVVTYAFALFLSWYFGRSIFRVPGSNQNLRIVTITVITALALWPIVHLRGTTALILQFSLGAITYSLSFYVFDILGIRAKIRKAIRKISLRAT